MTNIGICRPSSLFLTSLPWAPVSVGFISTNWIMSIKIFKLKNNNLFIISCAYFAKHIYYIFSAQMSSAAHLMINAKLEFNEHLWSSKTESGLIYHFQDSILLPNWRRSVFLEDAATFCLGYSFFYSFKEIIETSEMFLFTITIHFCYFRDFLQ